MRETTVKHGRLTWRRLYGRNMRLHSAFEQQKGSGLFWGGFGAIAAYGRQTRKKQVWIHFMKTWYGRFTWQKYLVRTNFFMGPFFFLWYKWGLSPLFFFLADANFPTDNPSHTDKPCLLWIRPIQITSGVCLSSNVTMIDLEKWKRYSFHRADQIILKPPNVISQIRFLVQRNLRRRV